MFRFSQHHHPVLLFLFLIFFTSPFNIRQPSHARAEQLSSYLGNTDLQSQADDLCQFYLGTNMPSGSEPPSDTAWSWPCLPNGTAAGTSNSPCLWKGVVCGGDHGLVQQLLLNSSGIVGTISPYLANITSLEVVNFNRNNFYSTIPDELSKLTSLIRLDFFTNRLRGTVTSQLSALTLIEYLDFSYNELTGKVPSELGALTNLQYWYMENNKLTGPIPSTISHLSRLTVLYFEFNALTSRVPVDSISKLSNLTILGLGNNFLSGSFPSQFGALKQLQFLSLDSNYFTSIMPASYSSLQSMYFLSLENNAISGPIPGAWSAITSMKFLHLSDNFISGSLEKSTFESLSLLQVLHVGNNQLKSSVPTCLGVLRLSELTLSNNKFTGKLPTFKNFLLTMSDFLVNNNKFSGRIQDVFGPTTSSSSSSSSTQVVAKALVNLDMSNNRFSGSITSSIFGPQLQTIALVSNCIFDNLLPEAICSTGALISIALDGLQSAKECRQPIWPGLKPYSILSHSHTLPHCLFLLPKLRTLHLSGNNLEGNIEEVAFIGAQLDDLSLSYNQLGGVIPDIFWKKKGNWSNFDLSHNKFTGEVGDIYAETLSLQVNRLSGTIPTNLLDMGKGTINLLEGNIFFCGTGDRSAFLPLHDPDFEGYSCGSQYLEISMVLAFGLVLFVAFLVAIVYFAPYFYFLKAWRREMSSHFVEFMTTYNAQKKNRLSRRSWRRSFRKPVPSTNPALAGIISNSRSDSKEEDAKNKIEAIRGAAIGNENEEKKEEVGVQRDEEGEDPDKGLLSFNLLLNNVRLLFVMSAGYIFCLLLPLYVILHFVLPSRYANSYAWVLSPSFLDGDAIPSIMFVVFVLSALATYFFVEYAFSNFRQGPGQSALTAVIEARNFKVNESFRNKSLHYTSLLFVMVIDVVSMLILNGFYVYSTLSYDSTSLTIVAIFVSQIKLIWNDFFLSRLLDVMNRLVLFRFGSQNSLLEVQQRRNMKALLLLFIVNNVVIPCLSTVLFSPRCFLNSFVQVGAVKASYSLSQCALYYITSSEFTCTFYEDTSVDTSYSPPFEYLNTCSSAVVQAYSPLFMLMYTSISFIEPIKNIFLAFLSQCLRSKNGKGYDKDIEENTDKNKPLGGEINDLNAGDKPSLTLSVVEALQNRGLRYDLLLRDDDPNPNPNPTLNAITGDGLTNHFEIDSRTSSNKVFLGTVVTNAIFKDSGLGEKAEIGEFEILTSRSERSQPQVMRHSKDNVLRGDDNSYFVFDKTKFISCVLTDLVILNTFGLLYPPLCIMILIAMLSRTYTQQLIFGRLAWELTQRSFVRKLARLERDFSGMGRLLLRSKKYIFPYAFVFLSLFVYDFFADAKGMVKSNGEAKSGPSPLFYTGLLISTPYVLYVIRVIRDYCHYYAWWRAEARKSAYDASTGGQQNLNSSLSVSFEEWQRRNI